MLVYYIILQGELELAITVSDVDDGTYLVDRFTLTFDEVLSIQTDFTEVSSYIGEYQKASLSLSYRITSSCPRNTYGQDCSSMCEPQTEYYCNYLGDRICYSNYYPPGNCTRYCDGDVTWDGIRRDYICKESGIFYQISCIEIISLSPCSSPQNLIQVQFQLQ